MLFVFFFFTDNALKKKSSNQITPCVNNINIWGQNLEGYFTDAIKTKTINDWMIAVAPSISYEYVYIIFPHFEILNRIHLFIV